MALKGHINSLRGHINQLSVKSYENLEGIRSLDFVFIFIPVEAAFMAALQHEPGLFREAYDKQIILVSPTTLLATLRTVENIWRYEKQNKNAEKIAKQAGALYDQFVLLMSALEDVGKHLAKTQEAYDVTQKRLSSGRGNLIKRVEDVKRLGAKTKKQIASDKLELAEADDQAADIAVLALEKSTSESDQGLSTESEA
jgi:DNA recombination protein RmuC